MCFIQYHYDIMWLFKLYILNLLKIYFKSAIIFVTNIENIKNKTSNRLGNQVCTLYVYFSLNCWGYFKNLSFKIHSYLYTNFVLF